MLDVGLETTSDKVILDYASRHNCVVISKDAGFLYLATAAYATARLIWIRLGNCRTKALLAAVNRVWPEIEEALTAGDMVIELR